MFTNPFANPFTTAAYRTQAAHTLAATERLMAEQLAAVESAHSQLRTQADAAAQHTLSTTRISIEAMLATQKAMLNTLTPAAE